MDRRRAVRTGLAAALAGALVLAGGGPAPADPQPGKIRADRQPAAPRSTDGSASAHALAAYDEASQALRDSPGPSAYFLTPVQGQKSSDFGMRYDPYYHAWQLHAGVDLAAPGGTPIYAAADGQVVRAGWNGGNGRYTCISHGQYQGQNLSTCYAHQSAILVAAGQWVHRGQLIGRVGTTGASTGDHLHFEVRLDGTPVQPLNWLDACLC